MDKISSYPSGLLEADARAKSNWAPRVHSPERPGELAPTERVLWPKILGPIAHSLGKPNVSGAIPYVGRPLWPNFADLEKFQKLHRFPNKTVPFSQNEIAQFFQHPVTSKITYLIN